MSDKPSSQPGGTIGKAVDNLEQMLEKADNEINYLTRKMSFELDYGKDGKAKPNPVHVLDKVHAIKEEFSAVAKDLEDIERQKTETVDFLRNQLMTMGEMLQKLESRTGVLEDLGDTNIQNFDQLAEMLGVNLDALLPSSSSSTCDSGSLPSSESETSQASAAGPSLSVSSMNSVDASSLEETTSPPEKVPEEPQLSAYDCRADSSEFIPLTQDEFMSVSELIRLRAKLDDVNRTYKLLWQHFKEEGNTNPLTPREMNAKGMKVTGATGEAKLKILRALKLCKISKKGDVTLT